MVKSNYNEKLEKIRIELIKYLILKEEKTLISNESEIFVHLGISNAKDKKALRKVLNKMVMEESIIYDKKKGHIALKTCEYDVGEIVLNGINDFAIELDGRKVSVRSSNLMGAYVGDKVLFSHKDKKIKSIIEKKNNPRIFECIRVDDEIKIIPFNLRDTDDYRFIFKEPIVLTGNEILSAYVNYNEEEECYECEIKEVIGSRTERSVSGKIVLASNGIDINFSNKALEEAELISEIVTPYEKEGRVDLTKLKTFSLDTNRRMFTFDDAVSVERNAEGHYLVYLHMVDVAHYVKPNSAIFNEARKRSRTIYMHNYKYTQTMLPPKIAFGVCSLTAGYDRLAKTITLEFDQEGKLCGYDFFDSIVNVNKNFVSSDADKIYSAGFDETSLYYDKDYIVDLVYLNKVNSFIKQNLSTINSTDENGMDTMESIMTNIIKFSNEEVANHFPTLPFIYKTFKYPAKKDIIKTARTANIRKRAEQANMDEYNYVKYDIVDEILEYHHLPKNLKNKLAVSELLRSKNYFFSTDNRRHFNLGIERYTHVNSPARSFINLVNQLLFDKYNTEFDTSIESIEELESTLEIMCKEYNHNSKKYKKIEKLSPHSNEIEMQELGGIARGIILDKRRNKLVVHVKNEGTFDVFSEEGLFDIGDEVLIKLSKRPPGVTNSKAKLLCYKNSSDNI